MTDSIERHIADLQLPEPTPDLDRRIDELLSARAQSNRPRPNGRFGVLALAGGSLAAGVLGKLGARRALAVHGEDGMDEITLTAKTRVSEWDGKALKTYTFDPQEVGMSLAASGDISGGEPEDNARILRDILSGETGPRRDIVLLNASAALLAAGMAGDLQEGVRLAAEAIDSGAAAKTLERLIEVSNA